MPHFSIEYQRSHDIDWFVKIGNIYVHAMSFGGELPSVVNDRYTNTQILLQVYRIPLQYEELKYNDEYIALRLERYENEDIFGSRKERYLRHFKEMAERGSYSFDRDLNDEQKYHLIARPDYQRLIDVDFPDIPSLPENMLRRVNENDYLLVLNSSRNIE